MVNCTLCVFYHSKKKRKEENMRQQETQQCRNRYPVKALVL